MAPDEAARRLTRDGPNLLASAPKTGVLQRFAGQFRSPLIYLLLAAAAVATVLADWVDAAFIMGVLLINAMIGTVQETRADASAEALSRMIRQTARVRRGELIDVDAQGVVLGDIVEVETGMQVAADLRLIASRGLTADESLLTGESLPTAKDADAVVAATASTGDRTTLLHAGTTIAEGRGTGVVVATGDATALGAIAGSLAAESQGQSPLMLRMNRLSRQIALVTMAVVVGLGLALLWRGSPPEAIFLLAVALAVSAIPEGLPIAVTVALSAASRRMAARGVIVRSLPAVEGLGACTIIASDKTGTLTMNRLAVERVLLPDARALTPDAWRGTAPDAGLTALAVSGALCNEATEVDGVASGDAVDVALLDFARDSGCDIVRLRRDAPEVARLPYEPARKFAVAVTRAGDATTLHAKGAVETILPMCDGVDPGLRAAADRLAAAGYRVLAVASGRIDGALPDLATPSGLTLHGFVGLSDPVRPEVPAAIAACRRAGVGVRMVTGDHPATALAIAQTLGIASDASEVATGAEIAGLSGAALDARLATARVLARFEPAQKLALVRALQAGGALVAVTGDGVNDAPALKAAHIGVAMGRSGTDVARNVADLVLADDNFASIVAAIAEGRATYGNIRRIVIVLVGTGLSEVALFAAALALGLPMPLTAVQLLWLNVVTNGMQDVTIGLEPASDDALDRPPRAPDEALIDRTALRLMLPPALYMAVVGIGLFAWRLDAGDSVEAARNLVLFTTVLFQNAFVLTMRSERRAVLRMPLLGNPWLLAGVGGALILQLVAQQVPWAQTVLGVAPLSAMGYTVALLAALGLAAVTEATKFVVGRTSPTH